MGYASGAALLQAEDFVGHPQRSWAPCRINLGGLKESSGEGAHYGETFCICLGGSQFNHFFCYYSLSPVWKPPSNFSNCNTGNDLRLAGLKNLGLVSP